MMIFNLKKTGHNGKDCYVKITTTAAEAGKTKIATARPKETTRTAAYRTVLHFLWRKFRASSFTVFYFSFRVVGFGAKGGGWGEGGWGRGGGQGCSSQSIRLNPRHKNYMALNETQYT